MAKGVQNTNLGRIVNLDKGVISASHSQQALLVHRQAVDWGVVASDSLEMPCALDEWRHSCLLQSATSIACCPIQDLADNRSL